MDGEINRPISSILQDVVGDVTGIVRSEIKLAKAEITADVKRFARALPLAVAGAILGLFALGLLLTTILLAIAIALPAWLSALIVFVGTAIIAWALFAAGKARLRRINVVPEKTVNTIKENAEWVKAQAR
jgi:uncharacterized membrane protein YqjE